MVLNLDLQCDFIWQRNIQSIHNRFKVNRIDTLDFVVYVWYWLGNHTSSYRFHRIWCFIWIILSLIFQWCHLNECSSRLFSFIFYSFQCQTNRITHLNINCKWVHSTYSRDLPPISFCTMKWNMKNSGDKCAAVTLVCWSMCIRLRSQWMWVWWMKLRSDSTSVNTFCFGQIFTWIADFYAKVHIK